jgi:hypothetical protein
MEIEAVLLHKFRGLIEGFTCCNMGCTEHSVQLTWHISRYNGKGSTTVQTWHGNEAYFWDCF